MVYQKILYQSFLWRGLYFASTFLLNILFARFYQASISGSIFFLTNFYALILLVGSLSLESGFGFYVARKEISTAKLVNVSIVWASVIGLFIFNAFRLLNDDQPGGFSRNLFLFSSISYVCGILLTNYCAGLFYGKKNFVTTNIICSSCNVLLMIMLVISFTSPSALLNTGNYIYAYFSIFLLQGIALVVATKVIYASSWRPVFPTYLEMKKLLQYSLTAFISNVVFFLVYRVDYYFVKALCTPDDLGNYVQVSKLGQMLITIPSVMASAVFALTAGGQRDAVFKGLKVLSRVLVLTSGLLCFFLAITGQWLFLFVFGESFHRMYFPFLFLIPGILAISALYPLSAYYSGKNRISVNTRGSLYALAFIIVADVIFIPHFGIEAAALISSAGYLLCFLYVFSVYRKDYQASITGFFIFKISDITWIKDFVFNKLK